jgi:hypothetical protein
MSKAERIIQRLKNMDRRLHHRYGIAQLVFSDASFVSTAAWNPGPIEEIEILLQRAERPLGIVALLRDRVGKPYIQPWEAGDEVGGAELCSLAHYLYQHRM